MVRIAASTSVRLIFISGAALLAFILIAVLTWTYLYVRTIPVVNNPAAFTKKFIAEGNIPIELSIASEGWPWPSGRAVESSLFPFKRLKTIMVKQGVCSYETKGGQTRFIGEEDRYLNIDPIWKVFWVEISKCNEQTKFFGPYRSLIKL